LQVIAQKIQEISRYNFGGYASLNWNNWRLNFRRYN
jgi:hypothetical protein